MSGWRIMQRFIIAVIVCVFAGLAVLVTREMWRWLH